MMRPHRLLRLLAINALIGLAAALLAVGGMLVLDSHGLRRLIVADAYPVLTVVLLLFGFTVTFGSVAMGAAIMALGRRPDRPGGPAEGVPCPGLAATAVRPPRAKA